MYCNLLLLFRRSIINNLIKFLLVYSVVQEINLICSIIPFALECLKITFLREKTFNLYGVHVLKETRQSLAHVT